MTDTLKIIRNMAVAVIFIAVGYQVTCDVHCAEHRTGVVSSYTLMTKQPPHTVDDTATL